MRPIDGDVPFDGTGVAHMYRHGSVYLRLKDTSLWVKVSMHRVLYRGWEGGGAWDSPPQHQLPPQN